MLVHTPSGAARLSVLAPVGRPRAVALLLHGAGSDTAVPVLLGIADALAAQGVLAVRADQPYAVTGHRPPAPAGRLDEVVRTVATAVRAPLPAGLPLLLVGRSSGGRVACRTAAGLGAAAVVALGFPLLPPPPRAPAMPRSRAAELAGAGVPVLVVQGERDTFGGPEAVAALALPHVLVHAVAGADHGLATRAPDGRQPGAAVEEAVGVAAWWLLARVGAARRPA